MPLEGTQQSIRCLTRVTPPAALARDSQGGRTPGMTGAWPHKLEIAERIAREAGQVLLQGWEQRPTIEYKSDERDLVTEFDRRAEALIVSRLQAEFPQDGIVGEEGATRAPSAGAGTWYVDPLDGTVNFAHGLPLFSVSIGLQSAGGPEVGVVHAPAMGWTFVGAPGFGARRDGRPIRPSAVDALDRALLVTGFPTARPARLGNTPAFLAYNQVAEGVRRLGSAALDLCFVACGWLDGTWQRALQPWDMVGGAAILLGAGGTLTDLDGGPYDPLAGGVLASNGHLHNEMLDVLKGAGRMLHSPETAVSSSILPPNSLTLPTPHANQYTLSDVAFWSVPTRLSFSAL